MLGGHHYRVNAYRPVVAVILDRELGLGVRPEVWHQVRGLLADFRQNPQGQMREGERKRHVVLCVPAGVAEHHSLVSGSLLLRVGTDNAPVYVCALFVDCREYAAGIAVEHVVGLVVADAVDDVPHGRLDVHIGIFRPHFTSHDDEPGAAESLAGHLGLTVLAEEFVEDCVRNLVGDLVRMSLGNRF